MNEKSTFARRVRAARPQDRKYEIREDVISGLGLSIQPTGVRTFFLARMVRGRRRYARIGDADTMTVPEARREARRLIASYIEPVLRIHDLRHSWASTAAMNGVDMVIIAKLLGHALVETTERYTHLSDQSVADASDRVSGRIHAALAGRVEGDEGGADHAQG